MANNDRKCEKDANYLKCDSRNIPYLEEKDRDKGIPVKVKDKEEKFYSQESLRQHIEPWLTALFQSEHLSLLAGAGLSYAVQGVVDLPNKNGNESSLVTEIDDETWGSLGKWLPNPEKHDSQSLEKKIRDASDLINAYSVLVRRRSGCSDEKQNRRLKEFQGDLHNVMLKLAEKVLVAEKNLKECAESQNAFLYLVRFLMSFASRVGPRERLHIFTTNYDRFIEMGADLAGLRLLDRFVGGLTPIFRSSRLDVDMHYNPPGIRGEPRYVEGVVKFTKLHGSIDWLEGELYRDKGSGHICRLGVPFGSSDIRPYLNDFSAHENQRMMIYPNASKDRETAEYPYVDLFRDFAAAICRPNHTLVCYGYGFGDEHINRVIYDMLTIPSTHLVAISRTFDKEQRKQWENSSQVTYLEGTDLSDLVKLSDNYLPKPAIDLNIKKMAELLDNRISASAHKHNQKNGNLTEE